MQSREGQAVETIKSRFRESHEPSQCYEHPQQSRQRPNCQAKVPHEGYFTFLRQPKLGGLPLIKPSHAAAGEAIGPTYNATNLTLAVAAALQAAAGAATSSSDLASISSDQVAGVFAAAIDRWVAAGLSTGQVAALYSVNVQIGTLQPGVLGLAANNTIWIDAAADGYGWFVDTTPLDDAEFNTTSAGSLQAQQFSSRKTANCGLTEGQRSIL
jgi:hypothetical protein